MDFSQTLKASSKNIINLAKIDPDAEAFLIEKEIAKQETLQNIEKLKNLQEALFAEHKQISGNKKIQEATKIYNSSLHYN